MIKTVLKIPSLHWFEGKEIGLIPNDFVVDLVLTVSLQAHRAISGEPMHTFQ